MSGESDDLLGQIIAQTLEGDDEPLKPREPEPIDPRLQAPPEESAPRRWAHDPDVTADIGGIRTGHRFEFSECGPELDGVWVVKGLDLNHPNPAQRFLVAERPEGGPPYIKMNEIDFLDELRIGRARIL
jgi:hypothetical protein